MALTKWAGRVRHLDFHDAASADVDAGIWTCCSL